MDFDEKRHLLRLPTIIPCNFQGPRSTHQGRIRNISMEGAFIEAAVAPHPGAMVDVFFDTEEGCHFRASTKVVHRGFFEDAPEHLEGFGVCFESFEGDSQQWLLKYVASLQK